MISFPPLFNILLRSIISSRSRNSHCFSSKLSFEFDRNFPLPELAVFDLDMCLWSPEMYTLDEIPTESSKIFGPLGSFGDGIIGLKSGNEVIKLFPAALSVLQEIYVDKYPGLRVAIASSSNTPLAVKIARKSLSMLEVLPGVTVREVVGKGWETGFEGNVQIGRSSPLSADKSRSHFPIIRRETKIDYNRMIYFDDCIWDDHCYAVMTYCPGVIAQSTPRGFQLDEWGIALSKYQQKFLRPNTSD